MKNSGLKSLFLKNRVQHYEWGSKFSIPGILGVNNSGQRPWAELWMGGHPKAPSSVNINGKACPIPQWIHTDPENILGRSVTTQNGNNLPFLLKILAAEKSLSIQAHPDRKRAKQGFEKENALSIPLDAPHRNYRDPFHKPEIICALRPFYTLKGFRPIAQTISLFQSMATPVIKEIIAPLEKKENPDGLREFFYNLLTMKSGKREKILHSARETARKLTYRKNEWYWVGKLYEEHGTDIGVLAPLFMNYVVLNPGEALFLFPGELHAYLYGTGIELMANSDNVLRGGLTGKHVDPEGLLSVVLFKENAVQLLGHKTRSPVERTFQTPEREFALSEITLQQDDIHECRPGSVEILLCVEGQFRFDDGREKKDVQRGSSLIIPAAIDCWRLQGRGKLYRAFVPV